MKKVVVILAIFVCACATAPAQRDADDVPTPPPPGPSVDQRLTDLQTSMTELLERLDVMSDRIARLEQGEPSPAPSLRSGPSSPAAAGEGSVPSVPLPVTGEGGRRAGEGAPAPIPTAAAEAPVPRAIIGAQIADSYRAALMLYGKNRLSDARKAFQQVFDSDPGGELADNALYWIGETYFASGNYGEAIRYFRRVTMEFADQNKAPDAMYKTGMALEKSGDLQLAKQAFEECIKRYPYSTTAASSKQELERIKF
jgi:tol-pal system protein YbgF